ncbi:MAG: Rpn family recombination-promoting nuclease/putative transposase [Verrucomicrobiaceae bacterium]|nr:Rpn family recombination-promoting nuclease/putative transposase [Verrucomicrobiaceae bacterium]
MLSDPKKAMEFFQGHLPADIVAAADWSTLALQPASFVRQNLQQSRTTLTVKRIFCWLRKRSACLGERFRLPPDLESLLGRFCPVSAAPV